MDDLILSQPLDGFHPFEGPIDPNAANIRRNIASRILDPDSQTKPKAEIEPDNIDTFFDKVVVRQLALEGLRDAFPLKPNKEVTERPAGANIFRKRRLDGNEESQDLDAEVEKKVKVEDMDVDAGSQNIVTAGGPAANDDVDYDDLVGFIYLIFHTSINTTYTNLLLTFYLIARSTMNPTDLMQLDFSTIIFSFKPVHNKQYSR